MRSYSRIIQQETCRTAETKEEGKATTQKLHNDLASRLPLQHLLILLQIDNLILKSNQT